MKKVLPEMGMIGATQATHDNKLSMFSTSFTPPTDDDNFQRQRGIRGYVQKKLGLRPHHHHDKMERIRSTHSTRSVASDDVSIVLWNDSVHSFCRLLCRFHDQYLYRLTM